jgi:menaquinone-dependent protoporphyrinogen oxidase
MNGKILVAYASGFGATKDVADTIAKVFGEQGAAVDVRRVQDVNGLDGYSAVIVGGSIRMGQWLAQARTFVKTHREALSRVPVAYFAVCMFLTSDNPERRAEVETFLDPVYQDVPEVKPVDTAFFAGALHMKDLSLPVKLLMKAMKDIHEGDFRDWEAIRAWAAGVLPKLTD